jgi:hypothetical protein
MAQRISNHLIYSIAYGRTEEHAKELRRGLEALGPNFLAQLCPLCNGEGQYRQVYNLGCGQGMTRSLGGCDYCGKLGLLQGSKPAPLSVMYQVIEAGRRAAA